VNINTIVISSYYEVRMLCASDLYTERTILLRDLKFWTIKTILFGTLKITSNAAKNFNILITNLSVLHNYFDSSTKLIF